MTLEERRQLIDRYRDGAAAVEAALAGASGRELDARAAGKWSAREIVHHLADSEMTAAIRLRRLLAEEAPVIHPYDQDEFARRLHYDRPIESALAALRAARQSTVEILERMEESDWSRAGSHPEHGRYTPETWLRIYSAHAHNHAEQIRTARSLA